MASLEQLKALVAVAECASLKEAALRLFKTQPAITTAIKQLERSLGVELFNREGYRNTLNAQGLILYQQAIKVTQSHDELLQTAQRFSAGEEERITLAVEASFDLQSILSTLTATQRQFPATELVLRQEYLSGAVELAQAGNADLAIVALPPNVTELDDLELRPLVKSTMVNVAAPDMLQRHPGLQRVQELVDEYQVVVQDSGTGTQGQTFGVQKGQRRWYVNHFSSKKSLIESGMGWGRLPEHYVAVPLSEGRLVELKLVDLPSRMDLHYHLVRHRGVQFGPVADQLWLSLQYGVPQG